MARFQIQKDRDWGRSRNGQPSTHIETAQTIQRQIEVIDDKIAAFARMGTAAPPTWEQEKIRLQELLACVEGR